MGETLFYVIGLCVVLGVLWFAGGEYRDVVKFMYGIAVLAILAGVFFGLVGL